MAGRRSTGASATLLGNLYLEDRKRALDDETEERKFRQRLKELGVKGEIDAGRLGYNVGTDRLEPQALPPLMTMQGLESQFGGAPSSAGTAPSSGTQGAAQFETTITQELDQYGRAKGFKITRSPIKKEETGLIQPEEPPRNRVIPQALSTLGNAFKSSAGPSFAGFPGLPGLLNATRLTRSATGMSRPTPMPQASPVSQAPVGSEPPVRTATDTQSGRKVGQRRDGSLYYLDTGEPYIE